MWDWLVHSTGGLVLRIVAGTIIFTIFALTDLKNKGRDATRWREYRFLLLCVFCAIAYGIINDQITSAISWEYFYYGKGLDEALGPMIPPDMLKLHLLSIKIAAGATWTAGLIIGVALLVANNPSRRRPQLGHRQLFGAMMIVFVMAAGCAAAMGIIGASGGLVDLNSDFPGLLRDNQWRPYRFMCVFGVHLGGYVGALVGLIAAVVWIVYKRKRLCSEAALSQSV